MLVWLPLGLGALLCFLDTGVEDTYSRKPGRSWSGEAQGQLLSGARTRPEQTGADVLLKLL